MSASKADAAVAYVLRRMQLDGRIAYLMGWGTEAFAKLTDSHAEAQGLDVEKFRNEFADTLRPERVQAAA